MALIEIPQSRSADSGIVATRTLDGRGIRIDCNSMKMPNDSAKSGRHPGRPVVLDASFLLATCSRLDLNAVEAIVAASGRYYRVPCLVSPLTVQKVKDDAGLMGQARAAWFTGIAPLLREVSLLESDNNSGAAVNLAGKDASAESRAAVALALFVGPALLLTERPERYEPGVALQVDWSRVGRPLLIAGSPELVFMALPFISTALNTPEGGPPRPSLVVRTITKLMMMRFGDGSEHGPKNVLELATVMAKATGLDATLGREPATHEASQQSLLEMMDTMMNLKALERPVGTSARIEQSAALMLALGLSMHSSDLASRITGTDLVGREVDQTEVDAKFRGHPLRDPAETGHRIRTNPDTQYG
jgi:hypothetical protein